MRNRFAFVVGTIFLALSGCLYQRGYYPNGYYGPGPSVLPSQPWTGYPNGPTYQPGGTYPGGPMYQPGTPTGQPMGQPGGTYPTPIDGSPYTPSNPGTTPGGQPYSPTDSNQPSTYGNGNPAGGTNSAPPFNSNAPTGGGVPNPGDDNTEFNRSGTQRPTITPTSGVRRPNNPSDPFDQDSSRLERKFQEPPVMEADTPFETPVIQASASGDSDVRFANQQSEATPVTIKTYASDPQFQWVQGVVEYDDPSNTWVIMYNDNPRTSDQYGGELTLADDPSLARFRSGDVVRIYGAIDPSERDSRRKPVYRMTKAQAIKSATH